MKYKVHRLEVKTNTMQENLEQYLNNLHGEIISIVPHIRPTFQLMALLLRLIIFLLLKKRFKIIS